MPVYKVERRGAGILQGRWELITKLQYADSPVEALHLAVPQLMFNINKYIATERDDIRRIYKYTDYWYKVSPRTLTKNERRLHNV